jgi:hypothetical protein
MQNKTQRRVLPFNLMRDAWRYVPSISLAASFYLLLPHQRQHAIHMFVRPGSSSHAHLAVFSYLVYHMSS